MSRAVDVRSMIDPEALLLASLYLSRHEARFQRLTAWWAARGSRLLSVQRMRNLVSQYPKSVERQMGEFALMAVEDGRDARWRSVAGKSRPQGARKKDLGTTPTLAESPALLLRLRLGFGVGIKADVLGLLLGRAGDRLTVREIAAATGYYERAVRRAVDEMTLARLLRAARSTPTSFSVDVQVWARTLELPDEVPRWEYWYEGFSFLLGLVEWCTKSEDASPYVASSRARDLMESHGSVLELRGIEAPVPEDHPGEEYLRPFVEAADKLIQRLVEVV